MKKNVVISTAAAAALVFCASAHAADLPVKAPRAAPMVAPAFSWTGCYIGAQVGYGWAKTDHSFDNGAPSDTSNPHGILGGGHLGCNYQIATWVVGVEGDFEAADVKDGDFVNLTGGTSAGSSKMKWDGSVRGRFGFAFDRSLI